MVALKHEKTGVIYPYSDFLKKNKNMTIVNIKETVDGFVEDVADKVEEVVDSVQGFVQDTKELVENIVEEIKEAVEEVKDTVEETVEDVKTVVKPYLKRGKSTK